MENTNNLTNESFNQNIENNPTSPKQNNTFKILFIISILIVIGLVGFILFLLKNNTSQSIPTKAKNISNVIPSQILNSTQNTTPSPTKSDETDNWETYSNSEYNFSVKYPSDFQMTGSEGTGPEKCVISFPFKPSNNLNGYAQYPISISIYDTSLCDNSYQKILSAYGIIYSNGQYSGTSIEKTTVSGLEAIIMRGKSSWMGEDAKGRTSAIYNRTFIQKGNYVFLIDGIEDFDSVYKTMISSLKFN